MTFDNSKTIIGIRIKLFIVIVAILAYIILAYFARLIKFPLLGMSETVCTIILIGFPLFVAFLPMYLNYQFIYFSDDGENIVFRYFNAGMFGGRKNSVEINKTMFSGYKTASRLFGLIQSITLFQKYNNEVATYPPIYISALTREEKAKLLRSLNLYAQR